MCNLSIVTINLNKAEGLRKTIESVICQDYVDYEYIIVDGESKDESIELLKYYNEKITIWVSESDTGIYNAMNKGIRLAKGTYILFLNSGDCLINQTILSQVFNKSRESDLLYGNVNEIYDDGRVHMQQSLMPDQLTLANFNTNKNATIQHPASFIRRSLIEKTFFDETYKIIADIKFFIQKIVFENCTVEYLPFVISNFEMNGVSSSREGWERTIEERNRIFKELLPPRLLIDFNNYCIVKDSNLLEHIKYLENTSGFKQFISQTLSFAVWGYKKLKKV